MVKFVGDSSVKRAAAGNDAVGVVLVRNAAEIFFVHDERKAEGFAAAFAVAVRNVSEPALAGVIFKVQINFGNRGAAVGKVEPRCLFVELKSFLEPPFVKTGDNDVAPVALKAVDVAGVYGGGDISGSWVALPDNV